MGGTPFDVEHLGCKISQTDARTIHDALAAAGHEPATGAGAIGVVNACCITAEAEKKSRRRVRRLLDAAGDDGRVFVTGCGASLHEEQYAAIDDRVQVLPGAASLAAASIVEAADALADLGCRGPRPGVAPGHEPQRAVRHSRAFVKVQDGCSFACTYCIVPTVRGAPRSRTADRVLAEVERHVAAGRREIVLTGVNIGLYRDPEPASRMGLDRLLVAVADVDGVARVRVSSIEVNHVSRRLVAAIAGHPRICPHLHVPLQSGDDAVLAAMGRHYDTRRYLRALEEARSALPALNLTTDVIVGYPTEHDAAFARTLALVERVGFTKVHAFPFSERPGTDAAAARDPVPRSVKAQRSERLRAAADAAALRHRRTLVGTVDEVVVETRRSTGYGAGAGVLLTDDHAAIGSADVRRTDDDAAAVLRTGYTRDYSPVRFATPLAGVDDGEPIHVRLVDLDERSGDLVAVPAAVGSAP